MLNAMNQRLDYFVERSIARDSIDLYVVSRVNNDRYVAHPLFFEKIDPGLTRQNPTIEMQPADAQLLMDELWRAGFRPTEGTGSAGSLAATERHLADMQKIAFQLLPLTGEVTR